MANEGRTLQIYRDGRRYQAKQRIQLPVGAEANFYTMRVMRDIIREDSQFPDLRNFAMREIIGLENQTLSQQIDAAYRFCRDRIVYEPEKEGFETVADLWSCIYGINPGHPVGDCAIKSTALATVLSYLGLKPYFVAIRQIPNVDFFNHVFVGIVENGKQIGLDPTPENFRLGEQMPFLERISMPIFE